MTPWKTGWLKTGAGNIWDNEMSLEYLAVAKSKEVLKSKMKICQRDTGASIKSCQYSKHEQFKQWSKYSSMD